MTRDCPCFACQCEPNQVTKDAIREAREMTHHDDLLAKIDGLSCCEGAYHLRKVLLAVVELIQKKQKFLENTKGDIPMTNQQLGAREERTKLLAEIIQAIEKELE